MPISPSPLADAASAIEGCAPELLRRFAINGPRYTSYPTADRFVEAFGASDYQRALSARGLTGAAGAGTPLSVYVHLPFCESVCYYCACNKIVTRQRERVPEYLQALERELELVLHHLTGTRRLEQMHLGGGTPTYLSLAELGQLMQMLKRRFDFAIDGDYSIEIDPRTIAPDDLAPLAALGLNRLSLGVQDFDPEVQRAVHRVQSIKATRGVINAARAAGFRSINVDLIYGLPRQTAASFDKTIREIVALRPERVAIYHYAHLPERFKPQRRIHVEELPSAQDKMDIMLVATLQLRAAGYVHIGMDHFALPEDDLARAQRKGRLHRNFQGYTTRPDCDLIGLGVSAIGKIGPTYVQNIRDLDEYYDVLNRQQLPVARGIALDADDLLRRAVIMSLMCQFNVSIPAIELAYQINFSEYFSTEIIKLREFAEHDLIELDQEWISILPKGRLLVRAIAAVFDRHLQHSARMMQFSRII